MFQPMLYNKEIKNKKEHYFLWWKNSDLSNDSIIDEVMSYIIFNGNPCSIICPLNLKGKNHLKVTIRFNTCYIHKKTIEKWLYVYLHDNDFQYITLNFMDSYVRFYKKGY